MRKLSMEELNRLSVEQFRKTEKLPLVIILDNVRSLNNVGSAFRTSDAFLLEKIYLCGITGTPPHKEIQKTALGSTDSVSWEYFSSTQELIQKLKKDGFSICAVEQAEGSIYLNEFNPEPNRKYALIFGNEVFGVEDEVIQDSDHVLEIPQFGTKHSLNVSVSIGIVAWDFISKMKKKQ